VGGRGWVGSKFILKGLKSGLFVNSGQFSCFWIRIRIPDTDRDMDPGDPNQCRSVSKTLIIFIHTTIYNTQTYCWRRDA
jgi:hypothetical protein